MINFQRISRLILQKIHKQNTQHEKFKALYNYFMDGSLQLARPYAKRFFG